MSIDKVRISDADIQPAESVRDLGVLIDRAMTLTTHVNHLVGVCFFQLRQIRIIHRSLTTNSAHSLVRALIHACVDYCNGLLTSCPKYLTDKLQSVLHAAARFILATAISVVRYWPHAPTATMAWHSRSGEVQDWPTGLQVPPRVGSSVPLRLLCHGTSIVHSLLPAFSPVPGAPS